MSKPVHALASAFNFVSLKMEEGDVVSLKDKTLILENGDKFTDLNPDFFFLGGSIKQYLEQFANFIFGPTIQAGSGPLQPKDEPLYWQSRKDFLDKALEMADILESTIQEIKVRKSAENLTHRPE